jgi:hypothetical protein
MNLFDDHPPRHETEEVTQSNKTTLIFEQIP